ncbi:MAG: Crp/Fnr family transcriptional regulator [Bacteroidales bacterium]|nr:Crp/Fnr family transcriptional regulator [Bacteroidales bacterium]
MDSKAVFAEYLKKDSSLIQDEIELICSYFQEATLKSEFQLLISGNKYKKIIFVVEGILRVFIIDNNGEEVVKNFIEPNCFFADFESFDKNQNSLINVSAVTDCKILSLSKADANELINKLPKWEYLMKAWGIQSMNEMIKKRDFLLNGDSTQQYKHFVKHYPLLTQKIPLKYIASFLRITQSSLSRIRRQIV